MSENNNHDGKFLFGFFVGGLIGALIIFFLGTKEGKKTGRMLETKGKDLIDDLEEKLDLLQEKGKELVRQGEEMKEKVMDSIGDKKDEVTEAAAEKIDVALAHIQEMQQKGAETTATLRKQFKNIPKKR
ncbi:YtxH domain-containing protein [Candidatus Gottesmanbacteria bacterium]|nr:YtxH domain-containing protein [Candidatus Gottesmanbacteria bacterium]